MSDTKELETDTKVVEVEETKKEVVVEDKTKKEKELEHDNFKQREEIRQYKEEVSSLSKELQELRKAFEAKQEEEIKQAKESKLDAALNEAGIVDEKARKLAVKMLDDAEDISAGLQKVIEDYPYIVGKKKVNLPDTGNSRVNDAAVPDSLKLKSGLSKLINK